MKALKQLISHLKSYALLEYPLPQLEIIEKDRDQYDHAISCKGNVMNQEIKESLKSVYDSHATKRNSSKRPNWKNRERSYALQTFRDNGCARLLEIGAGTGQDSLFFLKNGLQVHAIDLSEEHVNLCQDKGIPASTMDVDNMSFEPNSFDCVYSMNCFLHIPKNSLSKALEETRRVMKSDGLFYLGVYGGKDFEGFLKWKDYYDAERFFAFYEFVDYKRNLEVFFSIVDAREVPLSDDLIFHAFLLRS